MSKLEMLKALVEKTTDKAELDKLNGEILAEIRAEEKAKLEKELAEKAADAERAAAIAKSEEAKVKHSGIEVGLPDMYKGRRFKANMDKLKEIGRTFKDDKKAEIVTKTWLDRLAEKAVVGQSTTGNVGGYAVAPEYPAIYFEYASEYSRALQICDNIPMNSNVMYIPTESTRVGVALTSEGTDATVTSAVFAQSTLTAVRFDAFGGITNELLQDENYPVVPILIRQFTEAIGQKVDSAVFNGTGSPMSSVFSAAAGYSVVLGTGSSTFATVGFSSFFDVVAKIPTARLRNAKWVCNRTPLWTYIYQIKDAASRPVFITNIDRGAVDGPEGKILGMPVIQLETGPSATAVSTAITVLGDFSGIKIGHRLDSIDLFMDPYSIAKSNQTQFYLFTRWGFSFALPNQFCRLVTAAA
jgi:HK97 family phage major capsid protein